MFGILTGATTDFLLPAVEYNTFVASVGTIIEGEGYKYWPHIGADEEIKGIFQITFIRDPSDTVTNPSLPDTIRFTDGVFRLKIVEGP